MVVYVASQMLKDVKVAKSGEYAKERCVKLLPWWSKDLCLKDYTLVVGHSRIPRRTAARPPAPPAKSTNFAPSLRNRAVASSALLLSEDTTL